MTWEGQNYLESVRDNTRWGKIKKIAKEKGIPLMFNTDFKRAYYRSAVKEV